jgi:hypothetical protein
MKTLLIATAVVAISGAAFAKDLNNKATVSTGAAAQMSDAEMDKVTAGDGFGLGTAVPASDGEALHGLNGLLLHALGNAHSPGPPGGGNCTAGRPSCPF